MSLCPAQTQRWNPQTASVLPVHMTQGLARKFLHPRRGSHLHRLHVVCCAGPSLEVASLPGRHVTRRMADCSGARKRQRKRVRTNAAPRGSSTIHRSAPNFHNDRCEARAGGGISGGVRPHPPAAHLLPGEQQLRRVPSRRKQERGAGVAESCVRNHKLERGREGERMERGVMQRKYIFSLKKKKKSSNFRRHEWAFG